ncbi:MAG: DUF4288 domain-containing protein [Chitinophagaceae bacterium]|nr:DUF4288 domain-containing protein [Chitinophagaceae bacterium]
MNWYLAKLVFRIICGDENHRPQFDEQLRLISAANEEEAFCKAQSIGEAEQETFYNQQEKLIQWRFINVSELYKISALIDGAELYSRIEEPENAALYAEIVHRKAAHIQLNTTHKILHLL